LDGGHVAYLTGSWLGPGGFFTSLTDFDEVVRWTEERSLCGGVGSGNGRDGPMSQVTSFAKMPGRRSSSCCVASMLGKIWLC
jgi:hypothetical protein